MLLKISDLLLDGKKEMIRLKSSSTFMNRVKWKGGIYKISLTPFGDTEEIKKWMKDNLSKKTKMLRALSLFEDDYNIFFKTKEDFMAFTLRWV